MEKRKQKSCCEYCGKKYTNKSSLEKHCILCSILYKNKRELRIEEEESTDIPCNRKLYIIIQELVVKIKHLEEKVDIQQRFIEKKKKKINVIEWLNHNKIPSIQMDQLIEYINVKEDDILFMMNHSFLDTFDKILAENIEHLSSNNLILPMFCFSQKANTIYSYSLNHESWIEFHKTDLIKYFNQIYNKIFKQLMEWKKKNEVLLEKNEGLDDLYIKTMGKLMSVEFKHETTLSKARFLLFNKLKTDMKQIIEYEFEF